MEQFSLEKWLQDKSRKVVTRKGKSVRIVCWDKLGDFPIVACVKYSDDYEVLESYDSNGYKYSPKREDQDDLFFADEEKEPSTIIQELKSYLKNAPKEQVEKDWKEIQDWYACQFKNEKYNEKELTEFEKKFIELIRFWMSSNTNPEENLIQSRFDAKEILNLAREEIEKENKCGGKQKPADKVKPKFKVGDWITNSIETVQITGYDIDYGYQVDYKGNLQHRDTDIIEIKYHLWSIQDAEYGDVLYTTCGGKNKMIFIYNGIDIDSVYCYCLYSITGIEYKMFNTVCHIKSDICPATKEQRYTLMKAMTDAGYTFDFDKKELKKTEQKPDKWNILSAKKGDMLSNGTIVLIVDSIEEFEGKPIINSWYFADSEKFYGKGTSECDRWEVDGFRIATEAECNYLLKMMSDAGYVWNTNKLELMEIEQKQEWSEEDERLLNNMVIVIQHYYNKEDAQSLISWLKSLKPQNIWKPNKEQMIALRWVLNNVPYNKHKEVISQMVEQFKEL